MLKILKGNTRKLRENTVHVNPSITCFFLNYMYIDQMSLPPPPLSSRWFLLQLA